MGRHLDIDFCAILVDFGSQVGKENEAKIDIKKGQNLRGFWWGGGASHAGEEFSPSLVGGIPMGPLWGPLGPWGPHKKISSSFLKKNPKIQGCTNPFFPEFGF